MVSDAVSSALSRSQIQISTHVGQLYLILERLIFRCPNHCKLYVALLHTERAESRAIQVGRELAIAFDEADQFLAVGRDLGEFLDLPSKVIHTVSELPPFLVGVNSLVDVQVIAADFEVIHPTPPGHVACRPLLLDSGERYGSRVRRGWLYLHRKVLRRSLITLKKRC